MRRVRFDPLPEGRPASALTGFDDVRAMLRAAGVDAAMLGAFFRAVSAFAPRAGVTAVDLGLKLVDHAPDHDAGPTIRIHVRDKRPRREVPRANLLPARFEGLRTDVIQGEYLRQGGGTVLDVGRRVHADPLRPGVSISHERGSFGTLGMFVRGRSGADANVLYLLSADHVLAEPGNAGPGDDVVQPGADDGGTGADAIAQLARRSQTFDAAIARVGGARGVDNAAFDATTTIADGDFPFIGQVLEKSGATTGVTQAQVDGIGFFEGLGAGMHLVPLAADIDDVPISDLGDSGAVWYDPSTARAIGLHVRGNAVPTPDEQFAVATSIVKLCQLLRVTPRL